MSEKLYTIAEMAKVLNIPESTARFYRDRYSEFMPHKGEGRKKRYKQEALEALRIIAEMSSKSEPQEDIAEQLSIHFTRFIEVNDETAITTAVEQQQYDNDILAIVADQKKQIEFLMEVIKETRKETKESIETANLRVAAVEQQLTAIQDKQAQTEALEAHVKEMNTKLLDLRDKMEQRQEKNKGFFSRIFKSEK